MPIGNTKAFDIIDNGGSSSDPENTYTTATFKRYNGRSWDVYYFKTLADLVGVQTSTSTGYADSKQFVTGTILDNLTADTTNTGAYAKQAWVNDAIGGLDAETTGWGADKTVATLVETDGIISATVQSIQIAESQVTNLSTDLKIRPAWWQGASPTNADALIYYDDQGSGLSYFQPTTAGYLYVDPSSGHLELSTSTPVAAVKTLNTNNTTAQTASSSEAISGSGTINLHKISKTGSYNDLLNRPTIPTVNNGTLTLTAGSNKKTFTANSDSDVSFTITASDLGLSAAMKFGGVSLQTLIDGEQQNAGAASGNYTIITQPSNGTVYLDKDTSKEFVWTNGTSSVIGTWAELGDEQSHALKSIKISAGTGLYGGGSLEANRTISLKTATSSEIGGIQIGYSASGTNYAVKLSNNKAYVTVPWTDTHYASSTIIGTSNTATANATASNSALYLNHIENGSVTSSHQIVGSGSVYVASDANGKLTITGVNTNTSHSHSAGVGLVGSGSAGTAGGTYTYKVALVDDTLDSNASLSRPSADSSRTYPVIADKDGKLATIVPWTDTNYDAGDRMYLSDTTFASTANKTFVGTTTPTETLITGDLWFDTAA